MTKKKLKSKTARAVWVQHIVAWEAMFEQNRLNGELAFNKDQLEKDRLQSLNKDNWQKRFNYKEFMHCEDHFEWRKQKISKIYSLLCKKTKVAILARNAARKAGIPENQIQY